MLIATLCILLFGGGSDGMWLFPSNFSKHVEAIVIEEDRQDELNDLFDQILDRITGFTGFYFSNDLNPVISFYFSNTRIFLFI